MVPTQIIEEQFRKCQGGCAEPGEHILSALTSAGYVVVAKRYLKELQAAETHSGTIK